MLAPQLPPDIPEVQHTITKPGASVRAKVREEMEYRTEVSCVTHEGHVKYLMYSKERFRFFC
jgi:hypothetical protein